MTFYDQSWLCMTWVDTICQNHSPVYKNFGEVRRTTMLAPDRVPAPSPTPGPLVFPLFYAVQPHPVNNLLITLASRHNIIVIRNLLHMRQLACSHKHDYATLSEKASNYGIFTGWWGESTPAALMRHFVRHWDTIMRHWDTCSKIVLIARSY